MRKIVANFVRAFEDTRRHMAEFVGPLPDFTYCELTKRRLYMDGTVIHMHDRNTPIQNIALVARETYNPKA